MDLYYSVSKAQSVLINIQNWKLLAYDRVARLFFSRAKFEDFLLGAGHIIGNSAKQKIFRPFLIFIKRKIRQFQFFFALIRFFEMFLSKKRFTPGLQDL